MGLSAHTVRHPITGYGKRAGRASVNRDLRSDWIGE